MVLIQNVDEGLEALERTDSLRETREIVEGLTGLGNKMVLPFIVAKILEMNNEGLYDAAIRAMPDEWRFEAHEYINLETLDPKRRRGATLKCRLLHTLGSRQVLLELL